MEKDKKIAAAMAAVMAYIKTEEEAASMLSQAPAPEQGAFLPTPPVNLWGMSGRQSQMQLGSLMQLKVFNGVKF